MRLKKAKELEVRETDRMMHEGGFNRQELSGEGEKEEEEEEWYEGKFKRQEPT